MHRRLKSRSVLVVDDDPAILIFIGRLLESRGMRALYARNADVAVEIAARQYVPIDVVLANLMLPGLSGPEAVNRVRELRPGLPALYMSARIDSGVIRIDVMHRDTGAHDDRSRKTFFDTICDAIAVPHAATPGSQYPYQ
jgi:DNA-binding response OmpR family regulator